MDPMRHNWFRRLMEMVDRGEVSLTPGQVDDVDIHHDDWCALLVQGGYCDCNPRIAVRPWAPPAEGK